MASTDCSFPSLVLIAAEAFTRVEPAAGWEHGHTALVLLLWSAAALVIIALTFRWRDARG